MTALVALCAMLSVSAQIEPLEDLEPLEPLNPGGEVAAPAPGQAVEPPPTPTQAKYPPGTTLFVDATSLALRTGPARGAALVFYLPNNARVTVMDDVIDPTPETIAGREGHWIRVKHEQHEGYVFDAYLVAAPPTLEESLDWTIVPGKRVGPITAASSLDDLVSVFGAANVGEARIPTGDGQTEPGTIIFPDDPEKRLFVDWLVTNETPEAVIVEGSRWRTTKGIGIGTRLSQIVEMNRGPITFAGFGWDYSGYVMSWRAGALSADHILGEGLSMFLAPKEPYLPADFQALQGDKEFSSDDPAAGKLNLYVRALTVYLRE